MKSLPALSIALVNCLFGTLGLFVTASGLSAFDIGLYRCASAAAALLIACVLSRTPLIPTMAARQWVLLLASGAAIVANWVLLFQAIQLAGISNAIVVYYCQPFLLLFLGWVFLHERLRIVELACGLVGFAGVAALVLGPTGGSGSSATHVTGLALAFGAAVLYAISAAIMKQGLKTAPTSAALVQTAIGILLLMPFRDASPWELKGVQVVCVAVIGVLHTAVCYSILYWAAPRSPLILVGTFGFLDPLVAVTLDWALHNNPPHLVQLIGFAAVLGGGVAASIASARGAVRPSTRATPPPQPVGSSL